MNDFHADRGPLKSRWLSGRWRKRFAKKGSSNKSFYEDGLKLTAFVPNFGREKEGL